MITGMDAGAQRITDESIRAFNARDIEGIVALAHPEIVIELFGGFADLMGDRFEGHDGVRRYYTDWFATFDTMHVELEEAIPAGDRTVGMTKLTATAEGSDLKVEIPGAIVWELKDEKIFRAGFYYDRSEALAAAGLTG
jgi:ketosteroid isomerase-like protein